MAPTPSRGPGPLLLALGLLAAGFVVVRARLEPPPPLPVDAPADRFSAGRALERLATLVGDDVPHPVGSPAADRVRARLLAEFAALGIPAEVQHGSACSARGASCGRVGNVVARLHGADAVPGADTHAVLVSAHHDSVAAGPGAGDDGAGVASVLELARSLSSGPALRNPVVFVLVDGEEAGLLGAQAFVDDHRWAQDIGVAVNLDAGGTRGVTSVTRTSPGNARVIDAFTAAVPRPYGASVIGAVYSLTPYDTDFSVYNKAEIPSIDLGFGEDKAHYHTSLDRLANLDPASVQHLGDTALALVRTLADADLEREHPGERVFLDALGLAMLAWPAAWTPIFAALALALLALATWRLRHVLGDMSARQRLLAALGLPLLIAGPALVAGGLAWLLARLTESEVPGHAEPWPARLAVWAAALAASGLVARWLTAHLGATRLGLALWWSLAVLTAVLAISAPAASVGLLPPVLVAAGALLLASRYVSKDMFTWPGAAVSLLCLVLPALMWLQAGLRVEAIFGLGPAAVVVLGLLFALLAPLWPTRPRPLLLGLTVLALGGAAWTLTRPAFSDDRPRRLSLVFHQDADTASARWLLDGELPVPAALRTITEFTRAPAFAWTPPDEPSWTSPTAPVAMVPPELTLEPGVPEISGAWGRHLRLRLRSPRGARSAALVVPDSAGLRWLAIDGETVPPYPEHRRDAYRDVRHHTIVALPPDGVIVELVLRDPGPVIFTVLDVREELPASAALLLRARPTWAVPTHGGDRSVHSRSFSF